MSGALPSIPQLDVGTGLGLPPELLALLGPNAAPALQGQTGDLNSMFAGATQRANQLANTANQIGGQYNSLLNQPWPMTSKWGDLATNLAGNISQAISPQMHGQEMAQQTIQQGQQFMSQSRGARLQALRDNYDKMADSALKAGDLVTQQKMLQKGEMLQKTIDTLAGQKRTETEQLGALTRTKIEQAGEMARTQANIRGSLVATLAARGAVLKEGGDPYKPEDYTFASEVQTPGQLAKDVQDLQKPIVGMRAQDIPYESAVQVNGLVRDKQLSTMVSGEQNDPIRFATRLLGAQSPAPVAPQFTPLGLMRIPVGVKQSQKLIGTVGEYKSLVNAIKAHYAGQVHSDDDIYGILRSAGVAPKLMKAIRDGDYSDDTKLDDVVRPEKTSNRTR